MNHDSPRLDPERASSMRRMLVDTAAGSAALPRRRRPALFVVVAAAVVVALGGGGALAYGLGHAGSGRGQAIAPVPTTSARPLDPATPSKTPDPGGIVDPAGTPSPTPLPTGPDLTDPSSWKITTAGVGPLTLGGSQTAENADAAVSFDVTAPGYSCPVDFYAPKAGVVSPKIVTQAAEGDRIDTILIGELGTAVPAVSPKTPSGIGLGATQAELLATYPGIEDLTVSSDGASTFGQAYGIRDGQGRWLSFSLDADGRVGEIAVSYTKGAAGEFC